MNNLGLKNQTIFVAGHRGLVGSAICRRLAHQGAGSIITRTHGELDLSDQQAVTRFFEAGRIDHVVLAAARVGGIHANNTYPAEFIYRNIMIEANVIHQAYRAGVKRLLFLGSSCIYPKLAPQPMKEAYLLTGTLEPTNAPYAVAKIAGIQLCESYNRQYGTHYRAVMPTNLYGPRDNFNLEDSHVLPAMIRKFHLAKIVQKGDMAAVEADQKRFGPIPEPVKSSLGISPEGLAGGEVPVVLWGSGSPFREFLYVDDMADASIFVMQMTDDAFAAGTAPYGFPFFNIGCGEDLMIRDLATVVAEVVGYNGKIVWDRTRHDGTPKKQLDISTLKALGWFPRTALAQGIQKTYKWYLDETAGDL